MVELNVFQRKADQPDQAIDLGTVVSSEHPLLLIEGDACLGEVLIFNSLPIVTLNGERRVQVSFTVEGRPQSFVHQGSTIDLDVQHIDRISTSKNSWTFVLAQ